MKIPISEDGGRKAAKTIRRSPKAGCDASHITTQTFTQQKAELPNALIRNVIERIQNSLKAVMT
ncbi:hypothetical protein ATN88_02350 [Enterovibrio coralii]|uniref:Uncharacterized protein n=1 Tax=Enterovibrio coralii TaxID=294935 RepID=A0A135I7W7_9GAMM|nr:hypothetical protein ATN88_02350 [Enterovibrio coralii]